MNPRGRPLSLSDDALLDVARDLFLERGLEARTSDIAKRARISESVIFYRYKTKEALLAAVVERELVTPPACARLATLAGNGAIADHLFEAGMSLIELMRRVLPFMMMSLASPTKLNVFTRCAREPHPLRRELLLLLTTYFAAEVQAERLRVGSCEVLAQLFLGGITQFAMSVHWSPPLCEFDPPVFVREMIDLLLHGVLAPDAAPNRRARDNHGVLAPDAAPNSRARDKRR